MADQNENACIAHRERMEQLEELIRARHPGEAIERAETHISTVLLSRERVYKVKKPVRYSFLDYSTLERRKAACDDELRLNAPLAADVYLGIRRLTRETGGARGTGADQRQAVAIDGDGPTIEFLVEMVRLPQEKMLDEILRRDALTPDDIDRVLGVLVPFYRNAERPLDPGKYAGADAVRGNTLDNLATLDRAGMKLHEHSLALARSSQLQYIALRRKVFEERIASGHVVLGHGDLKPEHVCLTEPVRIYDCIEFSESLRAGDVLSEIAFLAMECERFGSVAAARHLLEGYRRQAGDEFPAEHAEFYKAYRAGVRAKVELLKSPDPPNDPKTRAEIERYLQLAAYHAAGFHRPLLLTTVGISGSGKSTVGRRLAEELGAAWLRTDAVRHELVGGRDPDAAPNGGIYNPETTRRTYAELLRRGEDLLKDSVSVVLDGTFLDPSDRSAVRAAAGKVGAIAVFLLLRLSAETAADRVRTRRQAGRDISDARPELLDAQIRRLAEGEDLQQADVFDLDAGLDVDSLVHDVVERLGFR